MKCKCLFYWVLSSDDTDKEEDDGDNEKDVDESADGVARYDTEEPKHEKNDGDCGKHMFII